MISHFFTRSLFFRTYVLTNECSEFIIQVSKEQLFGKHVRTMRCAGERRIWGGHSLCTREKRDMREEEHTKEKGI